MAKKTKKQKHTRTHREFPDMVVDTKDFAGKIVVNKETGRHELKINSPVWYAHQLQKFRKGDRVTMYISSRRPKRTQQQNRYLWGAYYPLIAKETGEQDLDRLHALFTGKFLTTEIANVLGQQVRLKRSTAELSKAEFSEYIMAIEGETGIASPPTQNYFDPAPLIDASDGKE